MSIIHTEHKRNAQFMTFHPRPSSSIQKKKNKKTNEKKKRNECENYWCWDYIHYILIQLPSFLPIYCSLAWNAVQICSRAHKPVTFDVVWHCPLLHTFKKRAQHERNSMQYIGQKRCMHTVEKDQGCTWICFFFLHWKIKERIKWTKRRQC